LPGEPKQDQAPPVVNIVSVPVDYYVTSQVQPNGESRLTIEHEINPVPPIARACEAEVFIAEEDKEPIDVPEHEPPPILETIDAPVTQPYMRTSEGWAPIPPRPMQRPPGR
jgi:hypothetical protein